MSAHDDRRIVPLVDSEFTEYHGNPHSFEAPRRPGARELVVYGTPGPQGSKSFKGMRKGHAVLVESSAKVKPWRQHVEWAALQDAIQSGAPKKTLDGPLRVRMVFTLRKPLSAPKLRVTRPDRTPDLSKLARSTEDALTTAKVWADDARVVEYSRLAKVFPGEDPEALDAPGVRILIEEIQ